MSESDSSGDSCSDMEIESFSVEMEVSSKTNVYYFDQQETMEESSDDQDQSSANIWDSSSSSTSSSSVQILNDAQSSSSPSVFNVSDSESSSNSEFLLNDTRSNSPMINESADYDDHFDPETESEIDELESPIQPETVDLTGFFDPETQSDSSDVENADDDWNIHGDFAPISPPETADLTGFFDPGTPSELSLSDVSSSWSPDSESPPSPSFDSPMHDNIADLTVDSDTPDNQKIVCCPICLLNIVDRFPCALACGHMSCQPCIAGLITNNVKKCPVCRKEFQKSDIRRIFVS